MGQAVDPGVGGQPQRHRQGQLKIDDRHRGTAGEPGDQHLLVGLGVGDDGEAGDLRAGARGGRDRDDRRPRPRDLVRHLVVAQMPAIGEQHRHALGGVDRAAAADRDEAVEIAVAQDADAGFDDFGRRVGHRVGEDRPRNARLVEQPGRAVEDAAARDVGIGDDQGPRQAEPRHDARQFGQCAAAHRHQPGHRDQRSHRCLPIP